MGVFRRGARRLVPLALASVAHLASGPARAQNSGDKAPAVELFKRGRQLMDAKRYADACPLFAESHRLDPSGGTLLNLAYCHEQENRTASAWADYQDLLGRSHREGREDRTRFAQKRLAVLEPRLPRWTLVMGPNDKLAGVEVLRDGQSVPRPLWGSPVPVDPGPHQVEVRAPERKPWATTFRAAAGQSVTTEVPPLEATSGEPLPPSEAPMTPLPVVIAEEPPEAPPAPEAPRRASGAPTGRTVAGVVFGGLGAVGLGLGTYFGLSAFSLRENVDQLCKDGCDGDARNRAERYNRDGRLDAHLSTASFGVGVVGLGLGAYFLFVAPSASSKASASTSVTPHLAPGSAGLSLTRAW